MQFGDIFALCVAENVRNVGQITEAKKIHLEQFQGGKVMYLREFYVLVLVL